MYKRIVPTAKILSQLIEDNIGAVFFIISANDLNMPLPFFTLSSHFENAVENPPIKEDKPFTLLVAASVVLLTSLTVSLTFLRDEFAVSILLVISFTSLLFPLNKFKKPSIVALIFSIGVVAFSTFFPT